MANLELTDIPDTSLRSLTETYDLTNADSWLTDLAFDLNVASADIETSPLPFKVKRAMVLWVMCEVCRRNFGQNITTTASGAQTDWYVKKYEAYEKEFKNYTRTITAKILKGESDEYDDYSEDSTSFERG